MISTVDIQGDKSTSSKSRPLRLRRRDVMFGRGRALQPHLRIENTEVVPVVNFGGDDISGEAARRRESTFDLLIFICVLMEKNTARH